MTDMKADDNVISEIGRFCRPMKSADKICRWSCR